MENVVATVTSRISTVQSKRAVKLCNSWSASGLPIIEELKPKLVDMPQGSNKVD